MGILNFFRSANKEKHTASTAKERLQIIVAHERKERETDEFLPKLKEELLDVIRKYVEISHDDLNVHLQKQGKNCTVLELNVSLPDKFK